MNHIMILFGAFFPLERDSLYTRVILTLISFQVFGHFSTLSSLFIGVQTQINGSIMELITSPCPHWIIYSQFVHSYAFSLQMCEYFMSSQLMVCYFGCE